MSINNITSAFNVGHNAASAIAEEPQPKRVLKMDLKQFQSYSPDGVNFDFKRYMNPSVTGTSIITDKCWNLDRIESEPAPDAYFEMTIKDFNPYNKNERIGVGIGNQIFVNEALLGRQQNSFGYFNNGTVYHNSNHYTGLFPEFRENDTIGVGVLFDSFNWRRLYFTKNGQYLGVAPIGIHVGQDCFPGVTFVNDAYAQFSVNLNGPFKFDPKSLPNYRYDKKDRISTLPNEILFECINMASDTCFVAVNLCKVNKRFNETTKDNRIWKRLFMARFPWQNPDLKLRSWMKLFGRRYAMQAKSNSPNNALTQQFIENCEFEFECPLSWKELNDDDDLTSTERHCDKCNKTVYAVDRMDQLQEYSQMGRCVSLVTKEKKQVRRGKFVTTIVKKSDEN